MNFKKNIVNFVKKNKIDAFRNLLINRDFTIISNNCWGGEIYRDLGLAYQTPFVGLFMFPEDYIDFVYNYEFYLNSQLTFTQYSKYQIANQNRKNKVWDSYPIGLLDKSLELHFMHYGSSLEAENKWTRRLKRIQWNPDRIFFKFCDRDMPTKSLISKFDCLPLTNKVCFTSQNHPDVFCSVWIKECSNMSSVVDGGTLCKISYKYFDVIRWLNGDKVNSGLYHKIMAQVLHP